MYKLRYSFKQISYFLLRMKYVFTLIVCCVLGSTNGLFAQDIFQKHVGSTGSDFLTDMLRLPDGKFIALGYSKSKTSDSIRAVVQNGFLDERPMVKSIHVQQSNAYHGHHACE